VTGRQSAGDEGCAHGQQRAIPELIFVRVLATRADAPPVQTRAR
jgi:hypothetical protein